MQFKLRLETTTYFKIIFSFLFILSLFVYIFTFLQPHLIYYANQPIFLTSADFFHEFTMMPGRLIFYLSNFIAQALYFDLFGTIVVLTICCAIFWLGFSILRMFLHTHLLFFAMFVPIICAVALLNNYTFPFVLLIDVLILFSVIRLSFTLLDKRLPTYIVYPLVALPLYYFSGSSAFMVFSLSIILMVLLKYKSPKNLWFIPVILALMALLPFAVFKLFNLTLSEAYFHLSPEQLAILLNKQSLYFYFLYLLLPASFLILIIYKYLTKTQHLINIQNAGYKKSNKDLNKIETTDKNSLRTWLLFSFGAVLILAVTAICVYSGQNEERTKLIEANYYCDTENWDKAVEVALSSKAYNLDLNYCYNRAIRNNGKFLEMFFNYPQKMGVVSLFPDIINSSRTSMACGDINFDLGNICQSHHWAHESQSRSLYNPKILKRLVLTNLILGNHKVADKLLTLLGKSFHNEVFIQTYKPLATDTSLFASNAYLSEKRKSMPAAKLITGGITDRLKSLIKANNYNQLAYEHLQMYFLLDNQLDSFAFYLPYAKVFYKTPPAVFEEALILYYQAHGYGVADVGQFGISKYSQERYQEINNIMVGCNNDKTAAQPLLAKNYSNTYFYYILYLMPDLTDEMIEKLKNNQY